MDASATRQGQVRVRLNSLIVIACVVAIGGCANHRRHELVAAQPVAISDADIAARHGIFVATTRSPSAEASVVFGSGRASGVNFARVDMTVPKGHQTGNIERAKDGRPGDPAKDFTAQDVVLYPSEAAFGKAVGIDIAEHEDRVLVFVHGYNTGFDDGVYRMTQLVNDTKYPGTPVLFSWASAAKTANYVYDNNSTTAARDDLEATLRLLAKSRAKSIDIIAHSMGNWLTMETLRQLAISGDRDLGGKLGYVVLASPDIDVDVFKKQMARYGIPDRPFAVLLSDDDRALKFSSLIAGNQARVGDYSNAAELADLGVVVVDLSAIESSDRLNHAKFANNPVLVQLIGDRLSVPASLASAERRGSQPIDDLGKGVGKAVGSVAEIIITTPFKILTLGAGQ